MAAQAQLDRASLRVLIVTENASNVFGGEASLPLHIFRMLRARGVQAWMITHARNRDELQAAVPELFDRIYFAPDTWLNKFAFRLGTLLPAQIAYFTLGYVSRVSSQVKTRRLVRHLVSDKNIAIVHQPIPTSPREPSLLYDLGVPVVMGPMNGGMSFPPAFQSQDAKRQLIAGVTGAARHLSALLHQLMPGKLRAETLLVANERTRLALPHGHIGKVITLIENGVDLAVWAPPNLDDGRKKNRDRTQFVFMGRLVDWKAVDLLLLAFVQVRRMVNAELIIIGEGPMRPVWESQVQDLGLAQSVRFTGWLRQVEAATIVAEADVMVLPSLHESGGAVILEAMAKGLPIVATNWGGPPDYVDDSCGILVDPVSREGFVGGLATAMIKLAKDPALRDNMGRAAVDKIASGPLNWDNKIERILQIYLETLDRRGNIRDRPS